MLDAVERNLLFGLLPGLELSMFLPLDLVSVLLPILLFDWDLPLPCLDLEQFVPSGFDRDLPL